MVDILKGKYLNRTKGYVRYPRSEIYLLKFGLTDSEYLLLRVIKDFCVDWDKRHPGYETFEYNIEQINFYTGWSPSKIRRIFSSLMEYGFFSQLDKDKKLYRFVAYDEYQQNLAFGNLDTFHLNYLKSYLEKMISELENNNININLKVSELKNRIEKFLLDQPNLNYKYSLSSKVSSVEKGGEELLTAKEIRSIINSDSKKF